MYTRTLKTPRTKEEFVNRILSLDFDGDLRHLGEGLRIERASPQSFYVVCPDIGRLYELTVSIPRNHPMNAPVKPVVTARKGAARRQKKILEVA